MKNNGNGTQEVTEWRNRIVGHGTKPASEFTPHPNNWRKHPLRQKTAVRGSLTDLGWIDVVLINKTTGHTIDGHERIEEAKANGNAEVPYVEIELTPEEEAQALLTLDATAALASTDRKQMENLLEQITTTNADTMKFLSDLASKNGIEWGDQPDPGGEPGIDKAELLREKWQTQLGDLWQIGPHRILCGDSTKRETFETLMGTERAALVYTDPPYGVSYESRGSGESVINDELRDNELLEQLIKPAFKRMMEWSQDTAGFYIFHASSTRRDFEWAMDAVGLEEKQYLIWIKETFVMGHSDYRWQHEPFFYAQKAGHHAAFYGDRRQSTCWKITSTMNDSGAVSLANGLLVSMGEDQIYIKANPPKNTRYRHVRMKTGASLLINQGENSSAWEISRDSAADYLHPTQKPAALAKRAIENSSLPGELVLDSFLGGAATLEAADQTGRICRGMELDPKYIAVALERMTTKVPGISVQRLNYGG